MIEHTGSFRWARGQTDKDGNPVPFNATALAKVLDRDPNGHMYYLRYPLGRRCLRSGRPKTYIVVGTTRPETMLGDTAVAVHPKDARYTAPGRQAKVILPLVGREIPIIADEYSDPEKGSGAVKITPAHDFNDYEVYKRHPRSASSTSSMPRRSSTTTVPEKYRGLDRFVARKRVVADLQALGLRREDRARHARRAARRARQRGRRAVADRPVVRERGRAGEAGDCGRRERRDQDHPEELGEDLLRVDAQHPALVHLAPDLVGASDPGVVRAKIGEPLDPACTRTIFVVAQVRSSGRTTTAQRALSSSQHRRQGAFDNEPRIGPHHALARRGRARHVVLLRAVAVLDAGLAGQDAGARALLSDQRAGHRLRHHLLLGRAHDDDGAALHEGGAVPRRLHPRPRARREGRQDVEDQGQRHGPPGADRQVRRRRAALHAGRHGGAGPRHQALDGAHRGLSQLRHQAVERGALRRDERVRAPEGLRSGRREGDDQPLDRRRGAAHGRRRDGRHRGLQVQRGGDRRLRVHLGHLLRLVPGAGQADPHRQRRGGQGRDARHHRLGAGPGAEAAAPLHAVHHRGAVGAPGRGGDRAREHAVPELVAGVRGAGRTRRPTRRSAGS